MKFRIFLLRLVLLLATTFSSKAMARLLTPPQHVYQLAPAHWYTGFKDSLLEIIIYAENIDLYDVVMEPYEGISCMGKVNSGNRHIAYLQLVISPQTKAGNILFTAKPYQRRVRYAKPFKFEYELRERSKTLPAAPDARDVAYRVIIDRFANGDEGNDNTNSGFYRSEVNRADPMARHGGDIKGLTSKLDYIKSLGISTVWYTGVQGSDHPEQSFTGLSISNHYKVDPRLGNIEQLLKLSSEMHKKGLKSIMDINPNNISAGHWMYINFDTGWFNSWDTFIAPEFSAYSINDPYFSSSDRMRMRTAWFDVNSPDLNHQNPHIRKYLNQMYKWWIEYAGLNGYCVNRVAFCDPDYLRELYDYLKRDFPGLAFFTDTKTGSVAAQASLVQNNIKGFENNYLQSIPDYHLHHHFRELLEPNNPLRHTLDGYYTALSDDILYQKPENNIIFLENSLDVRAFESAGLDLNRWKLAHTLFLTTRGIPAIYYGSEVLMTSNTESKMPAQTDFPGGWKSDKKDKFTPQGRNAQEQMAWDYLRRIITFRNANPVLTTGDFMQYPVEKGIYVYFRYNDKNSIMVIANSNANAVTMDLKRFYERLIGITSYSDILNKNTGFVSDPITVPAEQALILKLY